jgi:lysine 6-dehydrogenase
MKTLVIGAGMMGSALAYDLSRSPGVRKVIVADIDPQRAARVAHSIGGFAEARQLDTNRFQDVVALMEEADVAVGATTYTHNLHLTKAAIQAKTHFCDLGGNMDVVNSQMALDAEAKSADVCILPNCGLAPGMACVIAAGAAKKFRHVDEMHIRVGGLPLQPRPPLNYQLVFSPEGLINEYIEPAEILQNTKVTTVDSMTGLEELEFPPPFGTLEAFNTSGGVSTLTRMFEGQIGQLDYKTIRYRGHCEKFSMLLDLGFASTEPIVAGSSIRTAREFFEELLRRKLPMNGPDVVLMRVTISGITDGVQSTLAYEMIDYYDEKANMTAMMRTTAFPTSIIAQMVADGTISARGVAPPEQCVPLEPFLRELKKREIVIRESSR